MDFELSAGILAAGPAQPAYSPNLTRGHSGTLAQASPDQELCLIRDDSGASRLLAREFGGRGASMLAVMSSRATVKSFWAAMQENDWERAAGHLTQDCVIDWPCSGERIVGREDFAAIQARYPTNTGRWSFDVHRIVAEEDIVVSEVTVTDEEQAARVVAFSVLDGSQIAHQIEYWPMPYDPQPGRADLTQPIARIP